MSWQKKLLQRFGSWAVRRVSNTAVPDTTSGFRAYTREAALRMTIVSEFSYTLESIIQAGKKRMAIGHVEIATNAAHAAVAAVRQHVRLHQAIGATIVRIYTMYEPLKVFTLHRHRSSSSSGFALALRVVYYYFEGEASRHVAGAVAAAMLMIVGFQVVLIGLVADAISEQPQADRRRALPRAQDGTATTAAAIRGTEGPLMADPRDGLRRDSRLQRRRRHRRRRRRAARPPRPGTRSSSSTTDRRTARARPRRAPARASSGIRTTRAMAPR